MGKFLDLQELSAFCQQKNLQTRVKSAKNIDEARAIIREELPDGKDASETTVRAYRNELKTLQLDNEVANTNTVDAIASVENNTSAITSQEEVAPPPVQDTPISTTPETTTPATKDSHPIDTVEKKKEVNPKEDVSDVGSSKSTENDKKDTSEAKLKKPISKKSDSMQTESITATVEGEKESVYVDKDRIKELDVAQYTIKEHEKSISLLSTQLEELRQKLNVTSKEPEKKNTFLTQIPNLNELLNGGSEKITVSINKDLLSKATKFVDANSLIRLESIIRDGYDLNSTIVQSILLAFIHQNSLL